MAGIISTKKLRASSLIEVIVALVIIMLVFGIASMTYIRIHSSSNSEALQWQEQLSAIASEAKKADVMVDREYDLPNGVSVSQTLKPYGTSENLFLLELEARDQHQKVLGFYRGVIRKAENAETND